MQLTIRILAVVIAPSIASAQTAPSLASSPAVRDTIPALAMPARILVLDCPNSANALTLRDAAAEPKNERDASTARMVAALCAREPATAKQARIVDRHHTHPATDETEPTEPREPAEPQTRLHAFADVRFSATDSLGSKNGFALGQFDLFARSQLSDNISVLSEIVLTALPRNTFATKLERLLLTYSPSDRLTASAGRFHSGIGYYNAAYHHGTWFQTATGRPLIFAIDGDIGVVPVHTLGITATGDIPSGTLGLRYLVEVGSGRAGQSSAALSTQPGLLDNNTPSINLGLSVRPDRYDGLQVGFSAYRNRLTLQDTSKAGIDETVGALYAVYKTDVVELFTEAVVVRHDSRRTAVPTNTMRGYYAQLSRRFGDVRPYLRMDYLDVPAANQLFAFLGRRSGPTLGIRYDFDALAALKVQTSRLQQTTRKSMNRVDLQVAFMF